MLRLRIFPVMIFLFISLIYYAHTSHAEPKALSDQELGEVVAMGSVDFSVVGNTARIFFDTHIELYAEIDSLKLGYYEKTQEQLTTRKFMDPTDPRVTRYSDTQFYLDGDDSKLYDFFKYNGVDIAYDDNDQYMAKYKEKVGQEFYVDGLQGTNDFLYDFSTERTQNTNTMDWDINWENVRLGKSPEEPMVMDGLVVQFKFEDIDANSKKLTEVLIGTNSLEGMFYADMIRTTGLVNTKMAHEARDPGLSSEGLVHEFNEVPVPVSLQRDSFLYIVDEFNASYYDAENEPETVKPNPGDPTDNVIHNGAFIRLGLDPSSPNYGFAVIAGYNELVASTYKPSGEMIRDSLLNAWNSMK